MIRLRRGTVVDVVGRANETSEIKVEVEGRLEKALNYDFLTGPVQVGSEVLLNTTAVSLGLGTGGLHFVLSVVGNDCLDPDGSGHIMKLRYTPLQVKILSVEEEESPYHEVMEKTNTLAQTPVIIGSLHSMLGPAAVAFKEIAGSARLVYVMTDGAALPVAFSRLVRQLKERGLVDQTVTVGHAFGGDLEAVNIHSGLLAARAVGRADAIIVCMGPGVVGTGTPYGTTALEVAGIVNAVGALDGRPVVIPRLSFADERKRHRGVSHHTITALSRLTYARATVAVPQLPEQQLTQVNDQLHRSGISCKHRIQRVEAGFIEGALARHGLKVKTMGRDFQTDPAFFLAAAAGGVIAARCLDNGGA